MKIKVFHLSGENKSVTSFFILFFALLLVMYIMWQQKERFFKYKANEIENFIAVYKWKRYIAIHMERSV